MTPPPSSLFLISLSTTTIFLLPFNYCWTFRSNRGSCVRCWWWRQMKAVLLCSHPGGGQSSRHDLTGRLPVEVIAGDAGGQGGGHLWCLRRPGVEWIHGNVQRIMLLCLCSKRPRGGRVRVHPSKHLLKSNILTVTLQGGLLWRSRRIAGSLMTSNQNTNQRWLKQGSDWHFQHETEAQAVKLELCHTADTSCHGCPQTINCKIFCAPWYVKNCCLCVGVLMWP